MTRPSHEDIRAAILRAVRARPQGLLELMHTLGLPRDAVKPILALMEGEGLVHQRAEKRHYHPGRGHHQAEPRADRDYTVRELQVAPGHRRIQFGDRYQGGKGGGQRRRDTPAGGPHPLAGIYE